ncbi:MAG: hypothetical protein BGO43_15745 [Gammaproteobacteria bacterium 39-13]|nr:class I SAM-dependent methyltransferase [Gammaproteobacteria bacterium]OJV87861.1 MAG: hypothetical protein BGO43_15745 [Gammaproteobacteria bacterium 39-13]
MEITGFEKIKEISKLGYIALRRSRISRSKSTVQGEYENGWKQYEAILEKCDTLESWLYLKGIEDQPIICNINGKMCFTSYNMPEFNRQSILRTMKNEFDQISSITEFGSGLGRNLLYIKKLFPHIQCYGYELCVNGVEMAKRASKKFGVDVQYSQLDFVNDSEEKYVFPKTDVAFTMYALEQIPLASSKAIQNILNHVHKGSVHIEPVVENYPMTLRGVIGKIDHWKIDYLRNFEKGLKKFSDIAFTKEQVNTSHNPLMYPSIYCVKKINSK